MEFVNVISIYIYKYISHINIYVSVCNQDKIYNEKYITIQRRADNASELKKIYVNNS